MPADWPHRYGDRPVTVLGTHFHHPTAGRIVSHGDAWRFAVDGTLDKDGRPA